MPLLLLLLLLPQLGCCRFEAKGLWYVLIKEVV